jgi:pimeloyl-ACP methyl ester carboxylesterase
MPTFVLIPGAGGVAWYWHRVVPLLERAGHEALAIDLPGDDRSAGLSAYAGIVQRAVGDRGGVQLVAQSMGGFTAAIASERVPTERIALVNAMIPLPGETAGQWWQNTGWEDARTEAAKAHDYGPDFDLETYFLHDVPEEVARDGAKHQRAEADVAFGDRCDFAGWPDVPILVLVGQDDRFFPAPFQERVASERLAPHQRSIERIRGGHLVALSNPQGLAQRLLSFLEQ